MAVPPDSSRWVWLRDTMHKLGALLPRDLYPEVPPVSMYNIEVKGWPQGPGRGGTAFILFWNPTTNEWWGGGIDPVSMAPKFTLYPDLESLIASQCAIYRLKGNVA